MAARRNDDHFRTAILEAAARLIAARGYHGVRIADIAAACGASTGTVHYHYSSKDDVLSAALRFAIERAFARQSASLRALDDARDRMLALIDMQLPVEPDVHGEWLIWLEYWVQAARRPELRVLHDELYAGWLELIREIVLRGQRQGVFRAGEPETITRTLAALIDGAALHVITGVRRRPARQ
jgi:AcrR family transcriptional regulator